MTRRICLSLCAAAIAVILTIGCKPQDDADSDTAPSNTTSSADDQDAEIKASLAKLSDADRALAEKQKTCPVSDKLLGSMDTPVKVSLEGKDVFLCCEGCEGALKEDPEKYLAKLPE